MRSQWFDSGCTSMLFKYSQVYYGTPGMGQMVADNGGTRELPCGRPKRVKVIPEQGSRALFVATESCIRY